MADEAQNTPREYVRIPERFGDEVIEVLYYQSTPLEAPLETRLPGAGIYPPLNPRSYVEGGIRVDQDVAVTLRDGITIYVDVFRPDGAAGREGPAGHPRLLLLRQALQPPGAGQLHPGRTREQLLEHVHVRGPRPCLLVQTGLRGHKRRGPGRGRLGGELSPPRADSAASTATTPSNGSRPNRGATAKWGCSATRLWPWRNGTSPLCSHRT